MKVIPFLLILISGLLTPGMMLMVILLWSGCAKAQVTSDGTTNTIVNQSGNNFNILNGIDKGNNLFHSFSNFSVPTGSSATFDLTNTPNITTIFSRVTGVHVSNIDGLIQTLNGNNPVSLFLMNPNGIVFGKNASLNIGGSFVGTTANSIKFADGTEFSTLNPTAKPLLTMSVPIGLQMGSNPGTITVQGSGHQVIKNVNPFKPYTRTDTGGLRVSAGNTLALVGGDVTLTGGTLTAPGGRIELGGVDNGLVTLNPTAQGFTLDYSGIDRFRNLLLTQKALVDASGAPAGSVQLQGRQISLQDGSFVWLQNRGTTQGGNIDVRATESLEINGFTPNGSSPNNIFSQIFMETTGSGTGGDIRVTTQQLRVLNGGLISNANFGVTLGGNIQVNATESIRVDGNFNDNNVSLITASVLTQGQGGNIILSTPQLSILNGGIVAAPTAGRGNGGDVTILADRIVVDGATQSRRANSGLSTSSFATGNAGNLTLNTRTLTVSNSGGVSSNGFGIGNTGRVTVNATESVAVGGGLAGAANPSQIRSSVSIPTPLFRQIFQLSAVPTGDSGDVTINTPSLTVADQARINVRNEGIGDGGTLKVNAGSVRLVNGATLTAATNLGEGGNINLSSDVLVLRQGSTVTTNAAGTTGKGGDININSAIILGLENSDIIANAVQDRGGNINITTQGIIGLAFRNTLTPRTDLTNDITASSQFNVNGTVQINNIGVDPNSGLVELPENVTDHSQQIATGCSNNTGSSFVATGRGGIPQNPTQQIRSDRPWSDIRDISAYRQTQALQAQIPKSPEVLIQATGWRRNADGKIELFANKSPTQVQQALTCAAIPKS